MTAHISEDPVSPEKRWQNPLKTGDYRQKRTLNVQDRSAIRTWLAKAGNYRTMPEREEERQKILWLLRPIEDALKVIASEAVHPTLTTAVLLRECLKADRTFWGWSRESWVEVLGRTTRAFFDRNHRRVQVGVRVDIAAIAYLFGWFRDFPSIGQTTRKSLADRVFGHKLVDHAADTIIEALDQWGYSQTKKREGRFIYAALLENESPYLEDLTTERLESCRQNATKQGKGYYFAISRVLASKGIINQPLERKSSRRFAPENIRIGVADEWCEWVERWTHTSTIETRRSHRAILYKVGRWLHVDHPEIVSPDLWTRRTAADFIAIFSRLHCGEYLEYGRKHPRSGEPLVAASKAHLINVVCGFFCDCQEWEWIPRRFDPKRSIVTPRSMAAQIGPKPRVIADDLWARLLWAGLNLSDDDVPRAGKHPENRPKNGYLFTLEYIRALAVVWLFAALRTNEIRRLQTGCIRWQPLGNENSRPICLLDVPEHKTGACYSKPVDPIVGEAIEKWEAIRPDQPAQPDSKTGKLIDPLFLYRATAMSENFINKTLIPILCRKAGIPAHDVKGSITSHRARATIASQLFNSREPMSLSELQSWLGHSSPQSTQHYVAITPTKLTKAYTDAGYFERNTRVINVLLDRDEMAATSGKGEPWLHYDLSHGWCSFEFFDKCPHRMACARCDFYIPKDSSRAQLLEAKENIHHFVKAIPVTDEEEEAADGDQAAIKRLLARLDKEPTPSGQTPVELRRTENIEGAGETGTSNST